MGEKTQDEKKKRCVKKQSQIIFFSLQYVDLKAMVDMVPISSVVSDYDKLRMTSEGHNIGEQSEREEAEAAAAPPASEADDMEDGEICEDEEEDTKPSPSCNTAGPSASSGARSSSSKDSGSSRSSTRSSHGGPQSALSSWSGTVSARQGAGRSPGGDSSLFDPNEEYYRSSGHEERDRDYRYLDDNPSVIQDFSTDTDHRSPTSPSRYDSKRRRRSVSRTNTATHRSEREPPRPLITEAAVAHR
ncbi:hypothetical protein L596_006254 [Steinernema carpocapsae]|uniref:Uncharacterized protein n=2 Tax=Steinernema carpocapsae TaxID=34508 RepID=A0A4U8V325_STECR|nr:hypothetical protein L596_006254 [Steinernema carpocapsae]